MSLLSPYSRRRPTGILAAGNGSDHDLERPARLSRAIPPSGGLDPESARCRGADRGGAGEGGKALARTLSDHGFRTLTSSTGAGYERDYRVLVACRGGALHAVTTPAAADLPHRFLGVRMGLASSDQERIPQGDGDGTSAVASPSVARSGDVALLGAGLYVPSRGPQHRRNVGQAGVPVRGHRPAARPRRGPLPGGGCWWSPAT
jgi:hypothetical protein